MATESMESLINQAKQLIDKIQSHPGVANLEYSPDVTLGDVKQGLLELAWELNIVTVEEAEQEAQAQKSLNTDMKRRKFKDLPIPAYFMYEGQVWRKASKTKITKFGTGEEETFRANPEVDYIGQNLIDVMSIKQAN